MPAERPVSVSRDDLRKAAADGVITSAQADALWRALTRDAAGRPAFGGTIVAYYAGAVGVIAAMVWFVTRAWERLGGGGILAVAALYMLGFALAGGRLWRRGRRVPGGLLVTLAVCTTPLAVYGLQRVTGFWPQGDPGAFTRFGYLQGHWLVMETATVLAGLLALRFVPFPFLTAPIAFSLWHMAVDTVPTLLLRLHLTWEQRLWVTCGFGIVMLAASRAVDRRTREDFAFWGYLFGTLAFWGSLSLMEPSGEAGRFLYCLVNVGLVVLAVRLRRRVFLVFGALGVFLYTAHLASVVFEDSLLFPFALSAAGLLVIVLAMRYERRLRAAAHGRDG